MSLQHLFICILIIIGIMEYPKWDRFFKEMELRMWRNIFRWNGIANGYLEWEMPNSGIQANIVPEEYPDAHWKFSERSLFVDAASSSPQDSHQHSFHWNEPIPHFYVDFLGFATKEKLEKERSSWQKYILQNENVVFVLLETLDEEASSDENSWHLEEISTFQNQQWTSMNSCQVQDCSKPHRQHLLSLTCGNFTLWLYRDGFFLLVENGNRAPFFDELSLNHSAHTSQRRIEYFQVGSFHLHKKLHAYKFNHLPREMVIAIVVWIGVFTCCLSCSCILYCLKHHNKQIMKKKALRRHDWDEGAATHAIRLLRQKEQERWATLGFLGVLFYWLHGHKGLSEKKLKDVPFVMPEDSKKWYSMLICWMSISRFRRHVGEFLESTRVQMFLLVLLLVDMVILFTELTLEAFYPHSSHMEIPHSVKTTEKILYALTIVVLSIFELELLGLVFAFGARFFSHPLYVIDLFVITTALLIEVILRSYITAVVSSFLALMRLWRVGRLIQAVVVAEENRHRKTQERLQEVEQHLYHIKEEQKRQLHKRLVKEARESDAKIE